MRLTNDDFVLMDVRRGSIAPFLPYINEYFEKYRIVDENSVKYCLANILHETNDFKSLIEIGGGKDSYEGGKLYCGRGLPQLTHIRNYQAFQKWLKEKEGVEVDIIKNPGLVASDKKLSVLAAVWFWTENRFEPLAKEGKFQAVCALWNTGKVDTPASKINGWEDRLEKLKTVERWMELRMSDLM